jgi:amino acid adenylation domain-containing protein/thioester reductase-like protein
MRTIDELMAYLHRLNVYIWAGEQDRLHINAPKETLTPELNAELAARKTEILAFLRRADRASRAAPLPIQPIPRDGQLSLSFAQQRLWFLDQLESPGPVYTIPLALRLSGRLDTAALEQSLQEIIRRHEVLRTTFVPIDGQPVQIIHSMSEVKTFLFSSLPVVDVTASADPQLEARHVMDEEICRPFDLSTGPLVRAVLLKLVDQDSPVTRSEYILLLTMHHIVSDGWSVGVFLRELSTLYAAFLSGRPSPLPELSIQYADYAYWQRQWLQGDVLETQLAYWRQKLTGAPALELPTDMPRPPIQTFQGGLERFSLGADLTQKLRSLGQRLNVTLYMILLTAVATLLARYSRQEDLVIGSPIANRNRQDIEALIGFFVNTLALRIDLSNNPTFLELLGQVCQVALEAYDHQDLPFERLIEALQPERSMSLTPLFQVMFVLQNAPTLGIKMPGLSVSPIALETGTAKFDLTLSITDSGQELTGAIEYNVDLFEADTIARMAGHFQTLLAAILENPEQDILSLPLLTEGERRQVLVEWNDTRVDYPRTAHGCLHELFEAQVERTPHATAVIFEDQRLTYRELNRRANQLARHLQALGVGPDVTVGVCMERSLEMVIGLYAILKAGGAYLPLEPSYPRDRLIFMLEDAQVPVVLAQGALRSLKFETQTVLYLDTAWETMTKYSSENPRSGTTGENLAYVIYTSGSTGKPKGTMNTHAGICNRLLWMQDTYRLTADDRVMQKTPFSFDVSVWEFFWPLLTGASLVVARPEGHKDTTYLVRLIAEQQITTLHFVPSMLQVFLAEQRLDRCEGLKRVICSGEALPFDLQERFFARMPAHVELHNLYGPTEAAVDVSYWACPREGGRQLVPIGRPIANIQIYLLDAQLQPVPVGVLGELHIGGVGLARGYLKRPDLTAERFIPNPFAASDAPGSRLYKTGDLARYLPDGNIEYLGRLDYQVKVRGFRIELGEIEAALVTHPAVREAVVMAWPATGAGGGTRLIAYFVPDGRPVSSPGELHRFLEDRLPDYMIPAAFVKLDAMPLTSSGKVNRRVLPAPDVQRPDLAITYVSPRNPVEELLATLWANVLGLEQIGIHDGFFELGGHSLLAAQLVFQIRDTFHVELPLRTFFENATIAKLATTISAIQQVGSAAATTAAIVPDLEAEAVLEPGIRPPTSPTDLAEPGEARVIFLTGATGFLGAFLLDELLRQTRADIYCLVSTLDAETAHSEIQRNLKLYSLWRPELASRIVPVVGDLAQSYLGFSKQRFRELGERIDLVYHCGALVNMIYPYYRLKPPNVGGTQEVIRLAAQKAAPLHYISTLSVFDALGCYGKQPIQEEQELTHGECVLNGYAQSKWVAEKLVAAARKRGLPACIYRLGTVIGDSRTGAWNTGDYVARFIKGCIQLGSMPVQDKLWRLAPVDYVSQAIVHLSLQPACRDKTFHIFSPHCVHQDQLMTWIADLGYALRRLPYEQWQAELKTARNSPHHALYPLLPFMAEGAAWTNGGPQFDCQNLEAGLAGTSIVCPPLDAELLRVYFSYFVRSGFLGAPPARPLEQGET